MLSLCSFTILSFHCSSIHFSFALLEALPRRLFTPPSHYENYWHNNFSLFCSAPFDEAFMQYTSSASNIILKIESVFAFFCLFDGYLSVFLCIGITSKFWNPVIRLIECIIIFRVCMIFRFLCIFSVFDASRVINTAAAVWWMDLICATKFNELWSSFV